MKTSVVCWVISLCLYYTPVGVVCQMLFCFFENYFYKVNGLDATFNNGLTKYRIRPRVKTSGSIWNCQEEQRELWRDRAGGYGIQDLFGMLFVESIEGDFYNVMGLPIGRVYEELKKLGVI